MSTPSNSACPRPAVRLTGKLRGQLINGQLTRLPARPRAAGAIVYPLPPGPEAWGQGDPGAGAGVLRHPKNGPAKNWPGTDAKCPKTDPTPSSEAPDKTPGLPDTTSSAHVVPDPASLPILMFLFDRNLEKILGQANYTKLLVLGRSSRQPMRPQQTAGLRQLFQPLGLTASIAFAPIATVKSQACRSRSREVPEPPWMWAASGAFD